MPQPSDDPPTTSVVRLLKGAALTFLLLGGVMAAWGIDKWIQHPEVRASQFGFQAPLWPAFVGFSLLGTVAAVAILWTAARRVEAGDDDYAQHGPHRRSKADDASNSNRGDGRYSPTSDTAE